MRIPPEIEARARSIVYGGDWTPPPYRSAATLALLRDGPDGLQVALMQKALGFARGMYVFPGGALDEADSRLGDPWPVAAIRETFEECGVLLCEPPVSGDLAPLRERDFEQVLTDLGAAPAVGSLHPFAHWVTPEVESRRFDTRFYAAALPAGQDLGEVTAEHDAVGWFSPGEALELRILPPTAAVLAELRAFDDVASALAPQRSPIPVMPAPIPDGDGGITWMLVNAYTGEKMS